MSNFSFFQGDTTTIDAVSSDYNCYKKLIEKTETP
jgi:hypothetical protein